MCTVAKLGVLVAGARNCMCTVAKLGVLVAGARNCSVWP